MIAVVALAVVNCAACHKSIAEGHAATPMARTLTKPPTRSAPLVFRADNWRYELARDGVTYSVSGGAGKITARAAWAVGFGSIGQTFLFERNGAWYESAVSFYSATNALDWTPGHASRTRRTLDEALGRRLEPAEAKRCFGCHSTSVEPLQPGVQCAQCHEGAASHPGAAMPKLSKLGPEEINALCSKCHPSWAEVAETGPRGVDNVRHQIYRLTSSRCYDSADRRIVCTACHDPHRREAARPPAAFDAKCGACHAQCKAGHKGECVTCHMPKTEIPGLHTRFTDHRIRVARVGEKYPD